MAQANAHNNPRRAFLSNAVVAGATAAVVATKAIALPTGDGTMHKLEPGAQLRE